VGGVLNQSDCSSLLQNLPLLVWRQKMHLDCKLQLSPKGLILGGVLEQGLEEASALGQDLFGGLGQSGTFW